MLEKLSLEFFISIKYIHIIYLRIECKRNTKNISESVEQKIREKLLPCNRYDKQSKNKSSMFWFLNIRNKSNVKATICGEKVICS